MKITFQKQNGKRELGIAFTWMMTVESDSRVTTTDHFIPELFYDYFFIKEGGVRCIDETQYTEFTLPSQVLKTLYIRPLKVIFSTPLTIFGARFSLEFAESFWGEIKANCFQEQEWLTEDPPDLVSFDSHVRDFVQKNRRKKWPYPLLSPSLEESGWLVHFSPRHKRRLYKKTFGLSRKELQNVRNIHTFLEQTCDFDSQNPRIIQHINADIFYDQPHLNHSFKKMIGLSPLEYFEASLILQDNLMAASYNENSVGEDRI